MKGVGVIKYLSKYVPVKTLDQIYKIYVRPHLDFCDIIYHIPEKLDLFSSKINLSFWMEKVEKVQFHAALAVTGTWKTTSREKIYDELGWEPICRRRWFRRLVQFFKIQNGLTPAYLKGPVPPLHSHLYGLRSNNILQPLRCNRSIFKNSFYPSASEEWNNIGPEFSQIQTLSKFKSEILKLIRFPKRSIYDLHDPLYIRRLFQLRVGLSPLRYHKRGFRDNPTTTCSCNASTETTEHFLLNCTQFTVARNSMLQVINPILAIHNLHLANEDLSEFLLYGNDILTFEENKTVLYETLRFIKISTRFDSTSE